MAVVRAVLPRGGDWPSRRTATGKPAYGFYIGQEVPNNAFRIPGGSLGLKVSWQVTRARQDAFAKAHQMQVEVEKSQQERGCYTQPGGSSA